MKEFKLFDLDIDDDKDISDIQDVLDINNVYNISDIQNIYNPIAVQKEAEAKQTATWKSYQEAIVKAGQLTSDITKGIQAGEKPEVLLLKAIKCISLITDDKVFYELNKSNLKELYGLLEK